MSLMGTLAKVAVGVAVAKGAGSLMKNMGGGTSGSGSGQRFGGQHSNQSGGLGDMVGQFLSGNPQQGGHDGGLGGILNQLGAGSSQRSSSGGLDSLLGGLSGQANNMGGGLAGIIGGLAGNAGTQQNAGFGALLNQALAGRGEPQEAPNADQEAMAGLMLAAMIQAAKSDGKIDQDEVNRFTKDLGEIEPHEKQFIDTCMSEPIDIDKLVRQTPKGLEQHVYTMSIMGISLDHTAEAQYLHDLATAYGFDQGLVNSIHDQLGVPRLYN